MATIGNTREATFTDGSGPTGDVLNVDTVAGAVEIPNGKKILFYSDEYTTLRGQITGGNIAPAQSSSAAAVTDGATIATANVGVARVAPAAARTGLILASGTLPGQQCWVVNEAANAFSIRFAVSGTSHVADGVNDIIYGGQARLYVWDSGTSLWYACPQLNNGTVDFAQSATAVATGAGGTIATAGIGVSRISPVAARTGCILEAGTIPGQMCWVVNEAVLANSVTFDVSGTSNVAGGVNEVIPGLQGRLYVWDSGTSLWYGTPQLATVTALTQSVAAPALAGSGTITTAATGVSRVTPAAAVAGIILEAGTVAGQLCVVINEGADASSITFDVAGTSNVADGVNEIIYGGQARLFVWDSGTSRWYSNPPIHNGTIDLTQSATAVATGAGGTIATAGLGVSRISPAAARTGCILEAGTIPGQMVLVVNEAVYANSVQMDVAGTSNVADGGNCKIPGLSSRLFVWDSGTSRWYEHNIQLITISASQAFTVNDGTNDVFNVNTTSKRVELINDTIFRMYSDAGYTTRTIELSGGTISKLQTATAPDVLDNGTIATAVGVARVTPTAARTGIILGVGTLNGQELWVVNEAAAVNTLTMAIAGTSNVADGVSTVIAGLTAAKFVWNGALWFRAA